MESTPEQPTQTPTETSKGFIAEWGDKVGLGLQVTGVGIFSFLAGLNAAQGRPEYALVNGVTAGCFAATAIVKGIKMKHK